MLAPLFLFALAFGFGFGFPAGDDPVPAVIGSIPTGALLCEDGTPILCEDGSYLVSDP